MKGFKEMSELLYKSDNGDGTFTNPVLFADYSDPDVVRVGDTYYMTASSFNYTPGLPILISKDLVNWTLAGYALKNIPEERYNIPRHSEGVWAPAIRYHAGRFYIYYGMPDEGLYMVSAADPLGHWDPPVCVMKGKGLIDPCPFWDEDGKAYVVHAYAKSRIGFNNVLAIFEMTPDGKKALTKDVHIFNADGRHRTMEGPKLYKKNGYYYILTPAGGVKYGWQVALRSRDIMGPYEDRIVMRQGTSDINGPHQGAMIDVFEGGAHHFYPGDMSEDKATREYFVHFQDLGMYGRVTLVQRITWENGWPIMGAPLGTSMAYPEGLETDCLGRVIKDGCGEPERTLEKLVETGEAPVYLKASDDFSSDELSLQWQWMGNHRNDFMSLSASPGSLRLYANNPSGKINAPLWAMANVLTQKIVCPCFTLSVNVSTDGLKTDEYAGLIMVGDGYQALAVFMDENGGRTLRCIRSVKDESSEFGMRDEYFDITRIGDPRIKLLMKLAPEKNSAPGFAMGYLDENGHEQWVESDFSPCDQQWVGAKPGIFACTTGETGAGSADFSDFTVKNLPAT